jgi:chromosome segregation ATPase
MSEATTGPRDGMLTTLAETEAAVAQRRDQIRERLEVAQSDLATLRGTIDKTRAAYRDTLAQAELAGDPLPSRAELTDMQGQLPEAEDRVAALERALAEAEREWRLARAAVLDEQAGALGREAAERERLVLVLRAQIAALQGQINDHLDFIRNSAGVRPMQLQAEARRLRSAP